MLRRDGEETLNSSTKLQTHHQNLCGGPLSALDYKCLKQRWISKEYADGALLRRVDPLEGAELVGRQGKPGNHAGIAIPYIDPANGWVRDYRLRRDHPEISTEDGRAKEIRKYMSPPGRANMLYVPVGADPAFLANVDLPLVITEGEFKTIALWRAAVCSASGPLETPMYLPVGLAGVYNWRTNSPKANDSAGVRVDAPGPIADLSWIIWTGRRVVILYDSDLEWKVDVRVARQRLTEELQRRGAEVAWFRWPKNLEAEVKGADDFLAARGPEEMIELIAKAPIARRLRTAAQPATPGHDGSEQKGRAFEEHNDGVYWQPPDRGQAPLWLCPPLKVIARTSDLKDENCGKQVQFQNRLRQEKRLVIPDASLFADGSEPLQQLISMGFSPRRDRKSIELLKDFIYQAEPERAVRCVPKIGWHNGIFVLPDESFGREGSDEILFHSEHAPEHLYRTAGALGDWRESVAHLCMGNFLLVFTVSVAFAAPLLDLVKGDGAGFHLRGLSSTGKTTALLVAGSVWGGGGQNGFLDTWRATANGQEAKAALHNDALLCLDEFGEVSERSVGEIVYALGNGGGKARMTKHITSRVSSTFKLLYLSSGERSLADVMRSAGQRQKGGQEVRFIDIEADAGADMGIVGCLNSHETSARLICALSQAAKTYYGTPIRSYLRFLSLHREEIKERVLEFKESFRRRNVATDASGEVQRVADLFALVALAGVLAGEADITGWSAVEVVHSVEAVFRSWSHARGSSKINRDVESGIEATRAFLQANGANRFQNIACADEKIANRAGFREKSSEGWKYYLYPQTFRDEICAGFDYRAVAREMVSRGYMQTDAGRHLGSKVVVAGEGRVRLIRILPALLDGTESPDEQGND
jgi:uncharacterized protein (DUF927 family)